MAGQGFERREILRVLSIAAAAGQFGVFEKWAFACPDHPDNGLEAGPGAARYAPQFFTPYEYAAVARISDLIIPADNGKPGAADAGVSEFIDFMVHSNAAVQSRFRSGIAWLDAHTQYLYKQPFTKLNDEQQTEVLAHLAYKEKFRTGEEEGRAFFELMREYTVMGFYTSRAGLEDIGFPGLKQMWTADPMGCPHTDDREHLHLHPVIG